MLFIHRYLSLPVAGSASEKAHTAETTVPQERFGPVHLVPIASEWGRDAGSLEILFARGKSHVVTDQRQHNNRCLDGLLTGFRR
jgi:hypothetical protein